MKAKPKKKVCSVKLKTKKRSDGWWIVGLPSFEHPDCGPYKTKEEADAGKAGLERFYVENPEYADY